MPEEKSKGEPAPQPPLPLDDKDAQVEQAVQDLAKTPQPRTATIRDQIQSAEFKKAVAAVLGNVVSAERFVRVALTAMMRTPDLADCSQTSLFRALLDLSSYGLEPDGRRAHLIPYRNNKKCACGHEMDTHKGNECSKCGCRQRRTLIECQLIVDYKGLAELVRRSGEVSYMHADVVYSGDEWSYAYGTDSHLRHKPNLGNRGDRRIAYYSYVKLKDGNEDFIVLSLADVEKVRKRSRAGDSGPWVTDFDEMGKKTAFRRHSKWLPLSPEVRRVVDRDDDAVDVSGWDELLEEPKQPEATALPERAKLRDRLMPGQGQEQPKEVGQ